MTIPLSVVLDLLLRREVARGARLRRGPPVREGPEEAITAPAEALAATAQATEDKPNSPTGERVVVRP